MTSADPWLLPIVRYVYCSMTWRAIEIFCGDDRQVGSLALGGFYPTVIYLGDYWINLLSWDSISRQQGLVACGIFVLFELRADFSFAVVLYHPDTIPYWGSSVAEL